jgi:type IV pilus assembly protein PilA
MSQTNVTKSKKKERKQMKNNKGFSLVELIIVIAIMAILVGVMAPQLIKYIEKTNVSSDTQLCDSIKTAITTAMMDPSVISSTNANIPTNSAFANVSGISNGEFKNAVEEILGFSVSDVENHTKSTYNSGKASGVQFAIVGANSVHVKITNSDNTGKKGKNGAHAIYVD